jgi:release factor glutamine methyltransferase
MTVSECLQMAPVERKDAEMLLAFVLKKTRTELFLAHNEDISEEWMEIYTTCIKRLQNNEPIEYILCSKEFYGREFAVGKGVLIPRNATEILVAETMRMLHAQEHHPSCFLQEADTDITIVSRWLRSGCVEDVIDIGTGSGCIILTLALERMPQRLIGVEQEEDALFYAEKNRTRYQLEEKVSFIHGDGIEVLQNHEKPFFVVSNPPYIQSRYPLEPSVQNFEPHTALFAGTDGMDVIRPMMQAITANPLCLGFALECRADQVGEMEKST